MTLFTISTLVSLLIIGYFTITGFFKSLRKLNNRLKEHSSRIILKSKVKLTITFIAMILTLYGLPALIMNYFYDINMIEGASYVLIANAAFTVFALFLDYVLKHYTKRVITINKEKMSATISTKLDLNNSK